jgi:hypothetical protein
MNTLRQNLPHPVGQPIMALALESPLAVFAVCGAL